MPRPRDPNRDRAFEIWREHNGQITNRQIAEILEVNEKIIAVWKQRDKWTTANVVQQKPKTHKKTTKTKDVQQKQQTEPVKRKALPSPSEELTDRQRIFVMEYLRDFNITRAAIAAGYSKKTAHVVGWEVLRNPKVQAEIERLKELLAGELWLDIKRVIAEYMKIAFTDITDLVEFGQREVPVMSMFGPVKDEDGKPMTKIVNFVDFKESANIDGAVISEVKQGKDGVSIKLHDKMRALKELEKYLNYMTEEEKLKLEKLRAEVKVLRVDDDETTDDGFLKALQGKVSEVWSEESSEETFENG